MNQSRITIDMPMDLLMSRHPQTIRVLLDMKLHCVGCVLSSFHTIGDAAHAHEIDPAELLRLLAEAEDQPQEPG